MASISEFYPGRIVILLDKQFADFDTDRFPCARVMSITQKGKVMVNLSDKEGYHVRTVATYPCRCEVWPEE